MLLTFQTYFSSTKDIAVATTVPEGVLDDAAENIQDEILTLYRKDILSIFNPVMRACEDYIRASLKNMEEMPYVKEVCVYPAMPSRKNV